MQVSNGETDIENRPVDTGRGGRRAGRGEEEEREMYGESNMETYITICKIDSQREFAVWLRKLKQGGSFKMEGIYVYLWLINVEV